ncbi:MAG: CoA-disulfide reductase [Peptococcaceae bacterium]|nr:CoA-disulfide reductase [Peptococcaceae bacterium]
MPKKIVIVGGVAGGATASARLRRLDENSEIIIFEKGEYISFANCGLPYYVGGTIKGRDKLLVQTVKGMSERYKLDIRIKTEVIEINRHEKFVKAINLETGEEYTEDYDYLILSPGARPIMPKIQGIANNPRVFTLRTIPDAEAVLNFIEETNPRTALIVGGGFIGLEIAENLKDRGLQVIMIEAANQVQPAVDYEMACLLHTHLKEKGVELILQDLVTRFEDSMVSLQSGRVISADLLIISVGVEPENELALQAGLKVGEKGSIQVNEYLQTNDESIYALGDAIEIRNYITGGPAHIPLAWPANRQGRLAADNIYGYKKAYKGTLGTSVAKVFDLTVAATGMNEKLLRKEGISYEVVHIHPNSHAGYYPGASPIAMKLVFNEEGKILGAQAVGYKGVEKRIDVIAAAIKGDLTVFDLQDLELAYAPPYSSGKDPVNMIGYAASNILDGLVQTVQYYEIDKLVSEGNILVDVRQPAEVELGKIKGSVNIPLPQLRGRLEELPKDKPVYITCQVGLRGYLAARILVQNGFQAFNLDGGYRTYSSVFSLQKPEEGECQVKIDDTGKSFKDCSKER